MEFVTFLQRNEILELKIKLTDHTSSTPTNTTYDDNKKNNLFFELIQQQINGNEILLNEINTVINHFL